VRLLPWLLPVCAACGVTREPYEVLASANLLPGAADIHGPLELLGTGDAKPDSVSEHMFAAYHVRLPDPRPRRIRLFTAASCDAPHDTVALAWNLGQIRQVGAETHFFSTDVEIGGRVIDVDVVTRFAYIHVNPDNPAFDALGMIAVVQDLEDGDTPPGPGVGTQGAGPGAWLACGVFARPR